MPAYAHLRFLKDMNGGLMAKICSAMPGFVLFFGHLASGQSPLKQNEWFFVQVNFPPIWLKTGQEEQTADSE